MNANRFFLIFASGLLVVGERGDIGIG